MAALVQHGRRRGTPKSQDSSLLADQKASLGTTKQPKVALISMGEWTRIREQLSGVNREKEEIKRRQERREARHQQSLATVKNWENTIEGQRIKRLENRKLKALKEEEEKLRVDEEEAKYQAEQRRKAIERAKTMLYYRTDRVKAFHSNLILSEVLREREKQIMFKNTRKHLVDLQDKEYLLLQEEEMEKGRLADLEATRGRIKARKNTCDFQKSQSEEKAAQKREERKLQLEEQAAIEKEFLQWTEKEREREVQLKRGKQEHKSELDKVLADIRANEQRIAEQELAEDEERKIFAEAKKNMLRMRKAKEAEIVREARDHQERMNKQLQSIKETKVSDEDERIARAVAEQEARKEREEREKNEKLMKSMKDIHEHRIKMMSDQRQQEKEKAELDEELLRQRVAQDERFHAMQLQKQKKAALEAKDLQKFHKAQMKEKFKREDIEMEEEHSEYQKNMDLLKVEEEQFQDYAQKVIEEAKSRNAPTYPLKIAMNTGAGGGRGVVFHGKGGVRPSYQTTDSMGTELPSYASKQLPLSWRVKNTKKRMGFTW